MKIITIAKYRDPSVFKKILNSIHNSQIIPRLMIINKINEIKVFNQILLKIIKFTLLR